MALAVESVDDGNTDMAAINSVIDAVAMNLTTFLGLMGAWTAADSVLFDIPHHEDEMTRQFAAPTNLRIVPQDDTLLPRAAEAVVHCLQSRGVSCPTRREYVAILHGLHVPEERQSVLLQDPPRGGVPFHDDEGSYGSVKSADRRHVHQRQLHSLVVRLPVDDQVP